MESVEEVINKLKSKARSDQLEAMAKYGMRDSKAARWVASDALRELESEAVQRRLKI